ncbi:hypothetical protein TNCV_3752571 [Trichonephila clavipes]|nr:hypothetical protein TNCV_3752571 [Trichonephila clavipes]
MRLQEQRDALRQDAKKQIYKVQDENHRTNSLQRRQAHKYQLPDLVAIKRTQFGPGLKLKQTRVYVEASIKGAVLILVTEFKSVTLVQRRVRTEWNVDPPTSKSVHQ